jgi:hypothetical protein
VSIKENLLMQPGPSFTPGDRMNLLEILQRARRTETRLTRLLESAGIQTGIQRPWWTDDLVMIPSPMVTLDAVLKSIPENWTQPVQVVFKDDQQQPIVLCRIMR